MSEIRLDRPIVCAAILYSSGHLLVGPRHGDETMRAQRNAMSRVLIDRDAEQGFINTWGEFLTREQAWKVAEYNGQIHHRCGGDTANGGTLYSENLYQSGKPPSSQDSDRRDAERYKWLRDRLDETQVAEFEKFPADPDEQIDHGVDAAIDAAMRKEGK